MEILFFLIIFILLGGLNNPAKTSSGGIPHMYRRGMRRGMFGRR